jgi:hypothetical protein
VYNVVQVEELAKQQVLLEVNDKVQVKEPVPVELVKDQDKEQALERDNVKVSVLDKDKVLEQDVKQAKEDQVLKPVVKDKCKEIDNLDIVIVEILLVETGVIVDGIVAGTVVGIAGGAAVGAGEAAYGGVSDGASD